MVGNSPRIRWITRSTSSARPRRGPSGSRGRAPAARSSVRRSPAGRPAASPAGGGAGGLVARESSRGGRGAASFSGQPAIDAGPAGTAIVREHSSPTWGEIVTLVAHTCAPVPQPQRVPEISRFYGIVIRMFWRDHPPPHFHAEYGEHRAVIAIGSGALLAGRLPNRALRLVQHWEAMHRNELATSWCRARRPELLHPIDPLP